MYTVQIVVIREFTVDSTDDLQAERDAFQQLSVRDRDSAIAHKVFDEGSEDPGALNENLSAAWRFARENFHAIDPEWVK